MKVGIVCHERTINKRDLLEASAEAQRAGIGLRRILHAEGYRIFSEFGALLDQGTL